MILDAAALDCLKTPYLSWKEFDKMVLDSEALDCLKRTLSILEGVQQDDFRFQGFTLFNRSVFIFKLIQKSS